VPGETVIRRAEARDRDAVVGLLAGAGLPVDGVAEHLGDFYVAVRGGEIVGSCGLEVYGPNALLRSVAVSGEERGCGTGRRLVECALADATERGLESVVLLTTSASGYFRRLGFREIGRGEAPGGVRASKEFSHLCPSTATVMRLCLGRQGGSAASLA
jgi:amino-acid N-acetyltransferase